MSKNNNLTDFLTDLADTIRNNEGSSDTINPQTFSTRIKLTDDVLNITNTSVNNVRQYKTVQVVDSNLIASNIKKNVNILGITGTCETGSALKIQDLKTIDFEIDSDNANIQTITPDSSFDGMAKVQVNRPDLLIPNNIKSGIEIAGIKGNFTSGATATADDVVKGKTAYVNGSMITGTYQPITIEKIDNLTTLSSKLIQDNIYKWYQYTGESNNNIASGTLCQVVYDDLQWTWQGHQGYYSQEIDFTETIDFYSHGTYFNAIRITQSGSTFTVQYIYISDGVEDVVDVWNNDSFFDSDYATMKFETLPQGDLDNVLNEMATQGVKFSHYTNIIRHIHGTNIKYCSITESASKNMQLVVSPTGASGSYVIFIDDDYVLTTHSTSSSSYSLTVINAATQNSQNLYDTAWSGTGNTELKLIAGAYCVEYSGAGAYKHTLTIE